MKTDNEAMKKIILDNYTYTLDKKFRIEEEYNEDTISTFSYVYELFFKYEEERKYKIKIDFIYEEIFDCIIIKINNTINLHFDYEIDRTNFETFFNSFHNEIDFKIHKQQLLDFYNLLIKNKEE